MKKLIKYIAATCLGIVFLNSCSDDDSIIKLNPASFVAPAITSTATTVNLSEDTQAETAYVFKWNPADYGINTTPSYSIQLTKDANSFTNAKILTSTLNHTFSVDGTTLNTFLVDQLELAAGQETTVRYRIVSSLGTFGAEPLYSETRTLTLTPFSTNLSTPWGVVGTINNWGATPDTPFWKTTTPNVLEAYVTLASGDLIKFRPNNAWVGDVGGNGTVTPTPTGFEGSIGGDNITVPTAGNYKITLNLNNNTYQAVFFQWGLVGTATPKGWDGPDAQLLSFDGIHEVWYANNIVLKNGEFKIRQNNAWALAYGLGAAAGTLTSTNGGNIPVTAGTYNLIVDMKNLTYSLTPVQ